MADDELLAAPVYVRIERDLRARLARGEWAPGAMMPARADLARHYSVTVPTLQRAIAPLLADGTLRAEARRGTFVAEAGPARNAGAARLGVVCCSRGRFEDAGWVRIMVSAMERAFLADGGTSQAYNQYRGPDCPIAPLHETIREALAGGADAIGVVLDGGVEQIPEAARHVDLERIPIAFVTYAPVPYPVRHVYADSRDAGYQAARHLLRLGKRDIDVFAPYEADWVRERVQGARDAAVQAGLPPTAVHDILEVMRPQSLDVLHRFYDTAVAGARLAAAEGRHPKAVIAINDPAGHAWMDVYEQEGMRAGRDYAIVGFDDAESSFIGLTSLRPPLEALGAEAARLLRAGLRGETTPLQVRLRYELIPRQSSTIKR